MNKKIGLLLATLMVGAVLVGCGGKENNAGTTQESPASTTQATTEGNQTGEFSMTLEDWRSSYNETAGELSLDDLLETTDEDGNPAYMGQVSNSVSILITTEGDENISSLFFICNEKAHSGRKKLESAVQSSLLALGWDEEQVETARQELEFYNDEKNTSFSRGSIEGNFSLSKMEDGSGQTVLITIL